MGEPAVTMPWIIFLRREKDILVSERKHLYVFDFFHNMIQGHMIKWKNVRSCFGWNLYYFSTDWKKL